MNEKLNAQDSLHAGNGRRQAEEGASGSERFFSMLSQISTVGIFRTDVHGNCMYVNERWCKITGMNQSEALAGGWARAMHPDDRERVAQAWYTSKHAQLNFIQEYRIQRPDGAVRWVLGQATAERNLAGELVGYIGTITDITQIKQSEEALRKSETKYRTLYDSTSDAVMLLDEKGFFDCNKATLSMFGCATREEFCSKHPADLSPPVQPCGTDSLTLANRQIDTAFKNGSNSFEWMHKRADTGKVFPADVLLSAMELDDKLVLQATVRDISERKQLEAVKLEALDRLQKITQLVPGIVYQFRLRPDGSACVPYASEAAREIYRVDPEEIREDASRVFTQVYPDDLENFRASIQASARDLTPWQHEYRLKFDDGTVRWLFGNALPHREADGSTLWHGFLTDITERKKSEERLRQSEEKLRAYLDNISDTLWLIDVDMNMAYVSPSVTRLLGVLPEELIGRPSALVIHPDDMDIINNAMRYVMEHPGEPHSIQYRVSHKDGRWIYVESTGVNMLDNPVINGVLVIMRDITGRKLLETELRHSEETLNIAQTVAQIGSWFLDIPANRLEWSQETYRIFGISQQKAIDMDTFVATIHPDERDSVLKAWGEAMAGAPYDIEHRIVIGGQERWVRERARIERDSEGRPLTGIGTVQDITDRKLAESVLAESESRFREIFNTVSDAIFIHDAETGRILDVNRRMIEMYGLTREEALACNPDDLSAGTPPYSAAEAIEKIHLARTDGPQTFIWLARARDGHLFWVEVSLQFALIGSRQRILATVRDITERRQSEAALRESEYRWKFALEGSGDGLWDWNMADNTVFFSKRWKEMLGYSEDEIGNGLDEWEKRIHPDDMAETLATVQAYLDGKTPVYQSEHRVSCKDGNWKWILDRGMVVSRNEEGKPLRMIGTHADITERKQSEELIHNLAFYDTLTQLPNRRMLNDRMNQAMASSKRSGRYCGLLFLDLDNFKPLNDTYGHAVGDLLLKEVAHRISTCVREMDTVARFGGDEFVVMLTELDTDKVESAAQAGIVAEKIRITLANPYVLKVPQVDKAETTVEHHCTSSIGVVLFINHEDSPEDIIKWADMAMYQAKEDGRNLIRFHDFKG